MDGKQNSTNKTKGWLKGVLAHRSDAEQELIRSLDIHEYPKDRSLDIHNNDLAIEMDSSDIGRSKGLLFRESQDKISLDLIVAAENMVNDRQLIVFKNKGLEDQLHNAKETINHLKQDLNKKEHILFEKEKEIRSLEDKLTGKQMSYDQLLEDYKDYQNTSIQGTDSLKYQLEKERSKYVKLDEELTKHQSANLHKVNKLEEKLRDLEAENQQLLEQYTHIFEEKNQLLQTINDFTERMSFSLAHPDKARPAAPVVIIE